MKNAFVPAVFLAAFVGRFAVAAPVNDNFAAATLLTEEAAQLNGTTADATAELGELLSSSSFSKTVWYKYVPPRNGRVSVFASATVDVDLFLYQLNGGTTLFDLALLGSDTGSSGTPALRDYIVNSDVPIYIRVTASQNTNFSFLLNFQPTYSSTVVITGPAVLGRRTKITGRYTNPADVDQMLIGGSGAGRYVSGRFGNGTFYFYHQRVGGPARRGAFRKATYTVQVKHAGVTIGVARRAFRVR